MKQRSTVSFVPIMKGRFIKSRVMIPEKGLICHFLNWERGPIFLYFFKISNWKQVSERLGIICINQQVWHWFYLCNLQFNGRSLLYTNWWRTITLPSYEQKGRIQFTLLLWVRRAYFKKTCKDNQEKRTTFPNMKARIIIPISNMNKKIETSFSLHINVSLLTSL